MFKYYSIVIIVAVFISNINLVFGEVPVSPLTQLRTTHQCHKLSSELKLECGIGHKIRILESFYGVSFEKNRDYCTEGYKEKDCKSFTSFQNSCNGRSSCSVHFFQAFLTECNSNSNYLTVSYECVPDSRIHGVCSNVEDFSSWGTLKTTDFPLPYGANEDCWCKLVADNNQRIVLSVISFQLFPYDPTCSESGLYLQSDHKRSKECTFLQQGHYYISSTRHLYLNFYSKKAFDRGGFWIIYEASDAKSKIHLKCGDTDEVRPNDFTRFSTLKPPLTQYQYELPLAPITTTTPPLIPYTEPNAIFNVIEQIFKNSNFNNINRLAFFTTTPPTKPITNTFNLLNRLTSKYQTNNRISYYPTHTYTFKFTTKPITTISTRRHELAYSTLFNRINISSSGSLSTKRTYKFENPYYYITEKPERISSRINSPPTTTLNSNKNYVTSKHFFNTYILTKSSMKTEPSKTTTTSSTSKTKLMTTITSRTTTFTTTIYSKKSTTLTTSTTTSTTTTSTTTTSTTSTTITTTTTTTTTISTISSTSNPETSKIKITSTASSITKKYSKKDKKTTTTTTTTQIELHDLDVTENDALEYSDEADLAYQKTTRKHKSTSFSSKKHKTTIDMIDIEAGRKIEVTTEKPSTQSFKKQFTLLNIFKHSAPKNNQMENDSRINTQLNNTNQTEFMSAIGGLTENGRKSIQSINQYQEKKLTKTELTIIISCVLFITLLTFINLIIYAVRKLLKKPEDDKITEANLGDPGKKSYDILPGVGEIVLWAAKDKRGYLIDINGSWAKIDGQRWLRDNMAVLHNTYKKASMAYKNRFKKKEEKKVVVKEDARLIKRAPPTNGTYSLPPVPEAAEYELGSDNTSSSTSTSREEMIKNMETDYQIEHGQVSCSLGVNQKKVFQAPTSYSIAKSQSYCSAEKSAEYLSYDRRRVSVKYESDTNESNYYQENNEPYSTPDHDFNSTCIYKTPNNNMEIPKSFNKKSFPPLPPPIAAINKIYHCELNKSEIISSDTEAESAPVVKRPILIKGEGEYNKNYQLCSNENDSLHYSTYYGCDSGDKEVEIYHVEQNVNNSEIFNDKISKLENLNDSFTISNNNNHNTCISNKNNNSNSSSLSNGVKLDPSILKYSNQPVAIVAPNKSNPNTLEKKKQMIEEIPTLSLRTINLNHHNNQELFYKINKIQDQTLNETINNMDITNYNSQYSYQDNISHTYHNNISSNNNQNEVLENSILSSLTDNSNQSVEETAVNDSSNKKNSFSSSSSPTNVTQMSNSYNNQIMSSKHKTLNNRNLRIQDPNRDSGFIDEKLNQQNNSNNNIGSHELIDNKNNSKPPKPPNTNPVIRQGNIKVFDDGHIDFISSGSSNNSTPKKLVTFTQNHQTNTKTKTTVLFNNDENILMNTKTTKTPAMLSDDFYKLSFLNSSLNSSKNENDDSNEGGNLPMTPKTIRKGLSDNFGNINDQHKQSVGNFSDALQKASQIEDIISRGRCNSVTSNKENVNLISNNNSIEPAKNETQIENNSGKELNSDEFKFFLSAIEKLKATHLFHEDDLKKMTDEQIYEALIEHVRKQRSNYPQRTPQLQSHHLANRESIDKEQEEDLPIIMRNLHSVKSLKHFFEIRAKASSFINEQLNSNQQQQSQLNMTNSPILNNNQRKTKNILQGLFIKNTNSQQRNAQCEKTDDNMIKDLTIYKEETIKMNENNEKQENNTATISSNLPVPPPLPEFLTQTQSFQLTLKSLKQNNSSTNTLNGSEYIYQKPEMQINHDLHEKLIKEIHNKSLERSRKDQSICLDERGNLISKPANHNSKNQKLYKIKDSQNNVTDKITQLIHKQYRANNSNINKSQQQLPPYPPYLMKQKEINSELEKYHIQHSYHAQPVNLSANNQINEADEEVNNQMIDILSKQNNKDTENSSGNKILINGFIFSSNEHEQPSALKSKMDKENQEIDDKNMSNDSNIYSTRSMLNEAKAKLEQFSGKFTKFNSTNSNIGTNYLNSINSKNIYDDGESVQTKF